MLHMHDTVPTQALVDQVVIQFEEPKDALLPLLHPEEAALIEHSTSIQRRQLFAAGRVAGRRMLGHLKQGASTESILRGESNQPLFPAGIHASISHCDQLACAAGIKHPSVLGLGVDIEQRNRPLSPKVIERITSPNEKECYRSLPPSERSLWVKLFCAKEAIFKASFNYILRDFSFHDVDVLFTSELDARVQYSERLAARLKERCPARWRIDLKFLDVRGKTVALALLHTAAVK